MEPSPNSEAELRRQIADLERRLQEKTEELQLATQDLDSFAYSVSHDLRAPLRAVLGFCDIYMTDYADSIPADGKPLLDHVRGGAERMSRLIDDLLAFSRLGRQPMLKREVPVGSIVHRVIGELRKREKDRVFDIRVGELPDCHGDPGLMEHVLTNLLANAFKFTRGRSPAVIEVSAGESDTEQTYVVRDNGAGFDMKYADKLFGVFQRLHPASQFEGNGVGLAIAQRLIHRHGGRMWADSRPDGGATFSFSVPRQV